MIPQFLAWVTGWMELIKTDTGGELFWEEMIKYIHGARAFILEVGMTVGFPDSFRIMLLIDNWS